MDGEGVLVFRRRGIQDRQVSWKCFEEPQQHRVGCRRGGFLVEVLQQVAGVLRDQVDRMVLHRRDIGFTAADAELAPDVEAVGLQRLGVDLGDDLALGEVGRPDRDRLQVSRYLPAAERIGAAAGG
jgi:hypothetical protein